MPARRVSSAEMKHPVPVKFRHIQIAEEGGMDISDYVDRLLSNIQRLQTIITQLHQRVAELEADLKQRN